MTELTRRKFAFNKATEIIEQAVNQRTADPADRTRMQGQLNEAAITYINHWHETNSGQMMEPKALVDILAVMVWPVAVNVDGDITDGKIENRQKKKLKALSGCDEVA